jgi:hypothetical protein
VFIVVIVVIDRDRDAPEGEILCFQVPKPDRLAEMDGASECDYKSPSIV